MANITRRVWVDSDTPIDIEFTPSGDIVDAYFGEYPADDAEITRLVGGAYIVRHPSLYGAVYFVPAVNSEGERHFTVHLDPVARVWF